MRSRPSVLVVDDSPATCRFIATALQQAGYNVEIAYNGHEGLAKIRMFQPSCLVLDVLLPDISGYALCRYVQQSIPANAIYIILVSSKNAPLDRSYGLRQGAHRYLPKPFTAEALVQTVWEGIPGPLRHTVLPSLSSIPQAHTSPPLEQLVPHRVVSQGVMRTDSPFALSPVLEDKQARQLYVAIDGRRTLAELAAMINLEATAVIKPLRLLLKERRIQLYDTQGQLVEDALRGTRWASSGEGGTV